MRRTSASQQPPYFTACGLLSAFDPSRSQGSFGFILHKCKVTRKASLECEHFSIRQMKVQTYILNIMLTFAGKTPAADNPTIQAAKRPIFCRPIQEASIFRCMLPLPRVPL